MQQVGRDKFIKIIDKDRRTGEPLSVELAPDTFHPAALRNRQMQVIGVDIVPVTRCYDMPQRISHIMHHHLGEAGGPGGEIEQHRVIFGGLYPFPVPVTLGHLLIIGEPAFARAAHNPFRADVMIFLTGLINIGCDAAFSRTDTGSDARRFKPVEDVLGGEQVGCRDANRTDLMQCENGKPEFVVPLEHEEHLVALFDPSSGQHLGTPVRILFHLAKGEYPLLTRDIAPDHCPAVRLQPRDLVHHVIGKVEIVRRKRLKKAEHSVFVEPLLAEALVKMFHIHPVTPLFLLRPSSRLPEIRILPRRSRSSRGRGPNHSRWRRPHADIRCAPPSAL